MSTSPAPLLMKPFVILLASSLVPVAVPIATAQPNRLEISGDYRYAYHDPETPTDAKQTACREALHQAVGSLSIVREQTASVIDSSLLRDLVHRLAAGHVKEQQILEQAEKGRTVYCKVSGSVESDDVQRVILAQLSGGATEPTALDQNRALTIMSVREEQDGTIVVAYKALKRMDWLGTAYQGGLRESADVMVDFYDAQGVLIRTDRYPARKTTSGEDVMYAGEIRTRKIAKPLNAKSYRVWVVK